MESLLRDTDGGRGRPPTTGYDLQEIGKPDLGGVIDRFLKRVARKATRKRR